MNLGYDSFAVKRITEHVYDHKKSHHTLKIEEKYPNNHSVTKGTGKLHYFKSWLESLGDYRANKLAKGIENFSKNFATCQKYMFDLQINQLVYTNQKNSEKHYLKKLSDETINYINQRPMIWKRHEMNTDTSFANFLEYGLNIIEYGMNDKICEQMGITCSGGQVNQNRDNDEINAMTCLRSYSWIETYAISLCDISSSSTEQVFGDKYFVFPSDLMFLKNRKGERILGNFKCFREFYMQDFTMYYITYFIQDVNKD